jgi:hypothetical protein
MGAVKELYTEVKAPVTLVYGSEDWSRTAAKLCDVQVIALEETGHLSSLERPREVTDLIGKASQ